MAGGSKDARVADAAHRDLKQGGMGRFALELGLLRLLFTEKRQAPSKWLTDRGGWGTTLSGSPSMFTQEGSQAQIWAFIDGAQTRRSPRFQAALWMLRVLAVVILLGAIVQIVWSYL